MKIRWWCQLSASVGVVLVICLLYWIDWLLTGLVPSDGRHGTHFLLTILFPLVGFVGVVALSPIFQMLWAMGGWICKQISRISSSFRAT